LATVKFEQLENSGSNSMNQFIKIRDLIVWSDKELKLFMDALSWVSF